jgi:hypothetical protein
VFGRRSITLHAQIAIEYCAESAMTIAWDDVAAERMERITAFVRGVVVRAVEESWQKNRHVRGRVKVEPRRDVRGPSRAGRTPRIGIRHIVRAS